jgi:putative NADH-flavin reductase
MKVLVFGASGPSGIQVVRRLLSQGHTALAFVRNSDAFSKILGDIGASAPSLEIITGDVTKAEDVSRAFETEGLDAVISCLGTGKNLSKTTVYSEGTKLILEAMRSKGLKRLCVVTADRDHPKASFIYRTLVKRLLGHIYEDMDRLEKVLDEVKDIEWTNVKPYQLVDHPFSGQYSVSKHHLEECSFKTSRADLADCLIRLALGPEGSSYAHQMACVGWKTSHAKVSAPEFS